MKTIISLILCVALSGCATTDSGKAADRAVHADAVSTGIALVVNDAAQEANPLWPLGPVRYWANAWVEDRPCSDQRLVHGATKVTGWAATFNNLAVAASVSGAPWFLVPGALFGWWRHVETRCETLDNAHNT